jgi:iron complex outermembrane receptor protein
MSRAKNDKGAQVPKKPARRNTAVALAVLITGSSGIAAAQEATPAAPAAAQEAPAPAPAAPPAQPAQPEAAQPQAAQPAAAPPAAPPAKPVAPPPRQPVRPAPQPALQPVEPPVEEYVEEIVVTGSRIPRKELSTAAPVTVLEKEQLEKTGRTSIGEILQSIPEQSNAINTQFNNSGNGATRVNLRGLGVARTLVLLNGRRHVAGGSGADATVDLNSIPAAAIQRIEILKDGGSAVYGSDAIAGVVNIITRKDYSGTELRAFSGLSARGDGLLYDLSLTTGQSTERGNILFSAGYYTQKDVFAGDRAFSKYDTLYNWRSRQFVTEGSSSTPRGLIIDGEGTAGNEIWNTLAAENPDGLYTLDENGQFRAFDASGVEDAGGDLYNYQPENYLVTPQQRAHVYAAGGIRLGGGSRAFFEATYTNRQSAQQLAPEPLFTLTEGLEVSAQNVYNPFGRNFGDVRRRLVEFGTRDYSQDVTTFRIVTGVEGKFSDDFGPLNGFGWDVAFNFGRTQGINTKQGLLQRSRLAAAIGPSFMDPDTGRAVCGTPEAPVADCVPLNLFGGPGTITKEMADYLSYRGTTRGFTQQTSVTANMGGELFRLSQNARPSGIAVGFEHRREGGAYIPDPLTAKGDTTGNKEAATEGRFYVNEAYAELSLPVLGATDAATGENRDVLEFTGAARFFNYNTFGSDFTYKVGTRLSLVRDFTVRATYSTAFRAPSINQLFLGQSDAFPGVSDPCSQREQGSPEDAACDADNVPENLRDVRTQLLSHLGGNLNLKPETANVLTAGLVYEPQYFKDFSATVDYYLISVDEAITNVTSAVILSSCYPTEAGKTPELCERIHRNANGLITSIDDPLTNVGGDKTGGVDISLRYSPQTPVGRFGFSVDGTWLQKFDRTLASGNIIQAKGTYDLTAVYSDLKANVGVSWARDALSAAVNMRFINGFRECENNACSVQGENAPPPLFRNVSDYYAFDASVTYDMETTAGTVTGQLGVNNLFDVAPAVVANGFLASSDAATYDYMGRYFFLRLTYNYY